MMGSRILILLALAIVLALPFALRPRQVANEHVDGTLVIITPHNEAIRHEFARGFREWYKAKTGRTIAIDWRVIGGTSEIARFLESEYVSSFQLYWTRTLGRRWSEEVQAGFQNPRLPGDASAEAKAAREAFLKSDVGCGIDLFFGGGPYDFIRQAEVGRIVDSGILQRHPEWFRDDVIPHDYAGEEYWDRQGRWIGTVLSSYGMIVNKDSLARLGVNFPSRWSDMENPRLMGEVALADPQKSGSIAKAFENIIQEQMQAHLQLLQAANPAADAKAIEARAVREGWIAGLRVIQLAAANSRYFTDTSQKPPIDVAQGNSAVGMCIDFYGRQQEEAVERRDHSARLAFVAPPGGTVSSVDPIALMRGAQNCEIANSFIEYVLSMDGQKLWNFRPGTPGGPERFALRRLPVRKDYYQEATFLANRSDPADSPYDNKDPLIYRPAWTSGIFREMSFIIRVACLDTQGELARAWKAIVAAGQPSDALAVLQDLSAVDYDQTNGRIKRALNAKDKVEEIRLARELGDIFRRQYARAEAVAQTHSVAAK